MLTAWTRTCQCQFTAHLCLVFIRGRTSLPYIQVLSFFLSLFLFEFYFQLTCSCFHVKNLSGFTAQRQHSLLCMSLPWLVLSLSSSIVFWLVVLEKTLLAHSNAKMSIVVNLTLITFILSPIAVLYINPHLKQLFSSFGSQPLGRIK